MLIDSWFVFWGLLYEVDEGDVALVNNDVLWGIARRYGLGFMKTELTELLLLQKAPIGQKAAIRVINWGQLKSLSFGGSVVRCVWSYVGRCTESISIPPTDLQISYPH